MANPSLARLILLGRISSAHGIKGDVLIKTFTGEADAIARYGALTDKSGAKSFKLRVARVTPKGVIARVNGIEDRNGAEAIAGTDLYVDRSKLPKPGQGEYYHVDLIGLEARDATGKAFGTIIAVENFGAGDLLEIKFLSGGETDYVTFSESVVPEVNIAGGFAVVVMPEMVGEQESELEP